MADPNFSGTVTYVCEHNENGTIGLVVNRPSAYKVATLLNEIEIPLGCLTVGERAVLHGGPVQTDRGFVLHAPHGPWTSSLKIAEDIAMTTSKDILESLARGDGPNDALITMGYAGWGAGQLEEEIAANAWLTVAAQRSVLFDTPAQDRFNAAIGLLGISVAQLATVAGHA